jgi:hypothetical protein
MVVITEGQNAARGHHVALVDTQAHNGAKAEAQAGGDQDQQKNGASHAVSFQWHGAPFRGAGAGCINEASENAEPPGEPGVTRGPKCTAAVFIASRFSRRPR